MRRRLTLRQHIFRYLGIVSPSGSYPLPPRWAMSPLGRRRWYPEQPPLKAALAQMADDVAARTADGACACGHVCICGPVGAGPVLPRDHGTSGRQEGAHGC
jgi:hypothetical protein